MTLCTVDRKALLIERGKVFRFGSGSKTLSTAVDMKLGITTGAIEVVTTDRLYSGNTPQMTVALYQVPFTGGSPAGFANRRLGLGGTPPMTMDVGVTATLGVPLLQAVLRAATSSGNSNASFPGEQAAFILDAETDYVLSIRNDAADTRIVEFQMDVHALSALAVFNVLDF